MSALLLYTVINAVEESECGNFHWRIQDFSSGGTWLTREVSGCASSGIHLEQSPVPD